MAKKVRVTLSLDSNLAREIGMEGRRRGVSRSSVVEEALKLWARHRLEKELERGYSQMAGEDREIAEQFLPASREAIE